MTKGIDASHFIGTWKLLNCEHRLTDGTVIFPLGKNAKGFLIYTAEGYMNGSLMNPDRKRFKSAELLGGSEQEKAEAAAGYVHYAGPFEILEDRIIHHVEVSLFPNWIGSRQQRFFRFYDDKMELSTNAFVSEGVKQTAHLVWQRIKPE